MQGPIDPSEPMFPVRPNEPACQYYMKHGTCKFGQMCKFNHPPPSELATSRMAGNPVLVRVGQKNDFRGMWSQASESGVPILPQRPDEPDCIFFLKNGRCKYGSTCRYHHPLNHHNDRKVTIEDGRRHHSQINQGNGDGVGQPKLHYVSLPPGNYQKGQFVVADGQLAFLSLDGSSQGQVISVSQSNGNKEGPMMFSTPNNGGATLPMSRDLVSSTSSTSIASSYETASGSSLSHIVPTNRVVVQNVNEITNLPRVVSTGNTSDGSTVYYDTNSGMGRQGQSRGQSSSRGSWRGQRSSSFDHTRQGLSNVRSQDELHGSSSVPSFASSIDEEGLSQSYTRDSRSPAMRGRPPSGQRPQRKSKQSGVNIDDGLSMMTSSLLTMLDTPEEAVSEQYQDYDDEGGLSQSKTPLMGNLYSSSSQMSLERREIPSNTPIPGNYDTHVSQYMNHPGSYYDHNDQNAIEDQGVGMSVHQNDLRHVYDRDVYVNHEQGNEHTQRWLPNWQGSTASLQESAQNMQMMQQSQTPNSHDPSHVGLYLS